MFARGVKSKFFKLFIASRDFPHNDKLDEYRVSFALTTTTTKQKTIEIKISIFVCFKGDYHKNDRKYGETLSHQLVRVR